MVKRKRSREDELEQRLAESKKEIFRALKGAKGLERQRYSKRVRDDKAAPEKVKRLEREILVLKSLDLVQTAEAHLHSSLVKIKQIAESPALPEDIKQGVPKPELSEDEKAALHNVTSGLFNRVHVREAVEKAIRGVCLILNVPVPDKKKKGKKGPDDAKDDAEETPREAKKAKLETMDDVSAKTTGKRDRAAVPDEEENPFDEMDDHIPSGSDASEGEDEIDGEDEEKAMEKIEAMLGGSDEEDSGDEEMKSKYKALLSEIPDGDAADDESGSGDEEEEEDEEEDGLDEEEEGAGASDVDQSDDDGNDSDRRRRINAANVSLSPSPPPAERKAVKTARAKKPTGKAGSTTFLPSLMGGYVSNSESEASDLDLAPPKKRLGQKQRQAIWRRKYGEKANHVQNQAQRGKTRDNGWDMRKGAVGDEGGGKPWKRGVSNPLGGDRRGDRNSQAAPVKRPPPKKDNEGPLHPSWEARKKAKEAQTKIAFQGTKITF
ncbi:Protein bud22 [Colletotrichum spinosum]|uniref:Protein bud22 n=1 Tax=Colletotrichum spinosum TaxID=1347390 RepID=A0A4R8PX73_9PEZI|nr:Protein bud22 [Colletotrichum spinosum]